MALFLNLLLYCYILMFFMMMLSVRIKIRLKKGLFTMNVIELLIWGKSWTNWLFNLILTFETLWIGIGSDFLIVMLGKLNLFHVIFQITLVLLV